MKSELARLRGRVDMMRCDFSNLSERKLMDCITRLGYDIEIKGRLANRLTAVFQFAVPNVS